MVGVICDACCVILVAVPLATELGLLAVHESRITHLLSYFESEPGVADLDFVSWLERLLAGDSYSVYEYAVGGAFVYQVVAAAFSLDNRVAAGDGGIVRQRDRIGGFPA